MPDRPQPSDPSHAVEDANRALRLLLVEDNAGDATLLELAVAADPARSFRVDVAQTLAQAFEHMDREPVDLVVLDLDLPDCTGVGTYRCLRARRSELPVVVLTGQTDGDLGMRLVKEGAQDFLVKGDLGGQTLVRCLRYAVERKHHERELEAARAEALAASRAKTEFLASMSHEIRTPMNSILGMADLLLESGLEPHQESYVQIFRRSGECLLQLINGILDLSKVEAGRLELEVTEFSLLHLVESTIELMAHPAHKKDLALVLDVAPDLPDWRCGDPARLRQVLLNLLGNAVKFTERGSVVLRAESGDGPDALRLVVRDTGRGIPAEHLETVFERFTQIGGCTSHHAAGTGLGLSLCRQLVELMGGALWAESSEGEGSAFHCELALPVAEGAGHPVGAGPAFRDLRVLVADRTAIEREVVARTVRAWGGEASEATDAGSALRAIREAQEAGRPFDVHLLACRLPRRAAPPLLDAVCGDRELAERSVVLFPADRRSDDIESCVRASVAGWLEKPVKPTALHQCIDRVVRSAETGRGTDRDRVRDSSDGVPPLTLLLADDSLDNRSLIQAFLARTPHRVVEAENGQMAVERFRSQRFDLVLMDMQMPLMDGYEATRQIRSWEMELGHDPVPVLALTAYAFPEDKQRSFEAGCDAHLVKPVRKVELLDTILRHARVAQGVPVPERRRPSAGRRRPQAIAVTPDPEVLDLVPDYLVARREDVKRLEEALRDARWQELESRGHNMKGTGAAYGLEQVSVIGRDLERAAKDHDASALRGQIEQLADFLARVEVVAAE